MSSINFSTFSQQLEKAHKDVLSESAPTNWALFGYVGGSDLGVISTGQGGLDELLDEFEDGKIQFAICRVHDRQSSLHKVVFISWCPEGVPVFKKSLFSSHSADVRRRFSGYHVEVTARTDLDLDSGEIMRKVSDSAGVNYSHQQTDLQHVRKDIADKRSVPLSSQDQVAKIRAERLRQDQLLVEREKSKQQTVSEAPQVVNSSSRTPVTGLKTAQPPIAPLNQSKPNNTTFNGISPAVNKKPTLNTPAATPVIKQEPKVEPPKPEPAEPQLPIATLLKKPTDQTKDTSSFDNLAMRQQTRTLRELWSQLEKTTVPPASSAIATIVKKSPVVDAAPAPEITIKKPEPQRFEVTVVTAKPSEPVIIEDVKSQSDPELQNIEESVDSAFDEMKRKISFLRKDVTSVKIHDDPPVTEVQEEEEHDDEWEDNAPVVVDLPNIDQPPAPFPVKEEQEYHEPRKLSQVISNMQSMFSEEPEESIPAVVPPTEILKPETQTSAIEGYTVPSEPPKRTSIHRRKSIKTSPQNSDGSEQEPVANRRRSSLSPAPTSPIQQPPASEHMNFPAPVVEQPSEEISQPIFASPTLSVSVPADQPGKADDSELCAKTLFDYTAAEDNELTFSAGIIITDILKIDDGWWQGIIRDSHGYLVQTGLFPSNYVELLDPPKSPTPASALETLSPSISRQVSGLKRTDKKLKAKRTKTQEPAAPPAQQAFAAEGFRVRVLFDYYAAETNEISIRFNDIIYNVQSISGDWWYGEAPDGKMGLFPASYVERI